MEINIKKTYAKVREILPQLVGSKLSLVHHHTVRQRTDVESLTRLGNLVGGDFP